MSDQNKKPLGYVVSVNSSKGGVGKTTTCNAVGCALAEQGYKTILIDADPNYPQVGWAALSEKRQRKTKNLSVWKVGNDDSVLQMIKEAKAQADVTLVDLEGRGSLVASDAMSRSHMVLIPAQPSMLDSKEAAKGLKLLEEVEMRFERKIPHAIVFTKTDVCLRPDNYWELRAQFESRNTPILNVELHDREQFREVFLYGGSLAALKKAAESDLSKLTELMEGFKERINNRVAVPKTERTPEQVETLERMFRNNKVMRAQAERLKRKIAGYGKAIENANELVTAIVKFLQGQVEGTTYDKVERPELMKISEWTLDTLEQVELAA